MRILMKLVLAAAVLATAHSAAKAGDVGFVITNGGFGLTIGGNPTFRPQPYFYGPPMVYRGDWVPYQYAYPSYRPAPRYQPYPYNRGYHPHRGYHNQHRGNPCR